ncbi:MAG: hypothetical protein PWQ20_1691 [Thermotogaceae bacterium]|nr:hypothetical protein [Thermotogaceae bacterium]
MCIWIILEVMNMKKLILFSIPLMFFLVSCSISQYSESSVNVFNSVNIKGIKIFNPNGNVKIISWDGEEIKFDITKMVQGLTNLETEIKKIKVSFEQTESGILNCTVNSPKKSDVFMTYTTDIIVRVPKRIFESVEIELSNGKIYIEDIRAKLILKTSNGKIELRRSTGVFQIKTSNGDITLSDVQILNGDSRIESSNGKIIGSLRTADSGSLILSTKNGDIDIELFGILKMDLEMSTSNGKVEFENLNLDFAENTKKKVSGKINGGGFKLRISTSNGDVRVHGIPAIGV